MRFEIVCNQQNRLRVRFGKYVFTKEQCYGLTDMLLSFHGIINVVVNQVNGSLLVEYTNLDDKEMVLDYLRNLKRTDLVDGVASQEQKNKEIEDEFKRKILKLCVSHTVRTLFFPTRMRRMYTCCRSIPFLKAGFRSLLRGRLNVELLDATAIGTSMCCGQHKTASSTMFLLKLSDLLLEYSNARAKNELAQSLAINIDKVWLVKDDVEILVPMKELSLGDVVRIRKGSMIPIDGTIVSGEALINETTMTGEPLSVHKKVKGTVFAGTIIEDGEIDVSILALGNQSRIAKIIDMIDHGEEAKANIQGNAERLADGIVPISLGLFLTTLGVSRSIQRALSVLMVDFSCAIKLTTPITIISALKEASQHKIVVKGGKYLELLSKVDTIVFDKTGTLTNAVPKVSKVIVMHEDYTEDKVLRVAACLEEHFPHSVAMAIVAKAKEQNLLHPEDHEKVEYIVAHGIASRYNGIRSVIGSRHFVFEDEKVPFPTEKEEWLVETIGSDSAIYLAVDHQLVGVICVNDPPREDAKVTIEKLRNEGISNIIMITGDSEGTAKNISHILGIDQYYASVLPDGKAQIINQLKAEGKTILMVGDGINDTPALSCADVSLTMNGSSDIAREVSDVSILSDELCEIVVARQLATGLMNKISDHYKFIVSFNTMLILAGIGGLLPAASSAWLHNASTLSLAGVSTRPILKSKGEIKDERA